MLKVVAILLALCGTALMANVEYLQQEYYNLPREAETYGEDVNVFEDVDIDTNVDDVNVESNVNAAGQIGEDSVGYCNTKCPYGMKYWWKQKHCYSFSEDALTWYDAVTVCEMVTRTNKNPQNGWLSHIWIDAEFQFLTSHANAHADYWVGGTDMLNYGHFEWYGWKPINPWFGICKATPPGKGYAQCTYIRGQQMFAGPCTDRKRFICERRI